MKRLLIAVLLACAAPLTFAQTHTIIYGEIPYKITYRSNIHSGTPPVLIFSDIYYRIFAQAATDDKVSHPVGESVCMGPVCYQLDSLQKLEINQLQLITDVTDLKKEITELKKEIKKQKHSELQQECQIIDENQGWNIRYSNGITSHIFNANGWEEANFYNNLPICDTNENKKNEKVIGAGDRNKKN